MNKERELLERVLKSGVFAESLYITEEIKELLAQPERDFIREIQYLTDCLMDAEEKAFGKLEPEQEPKIEFRGLRSNGDSYCSQEPVGIVKTIGGYPDQSEHVVELTCRHGDLKDGDLLYTASPTRERLSEYKHTQKWLNLGYAQGIVDAEKAQDIIGGGEC